MIRFAPILFLVFASSSALAGWDIQNGGGGVFVDGRVMTFGSAQIPIGMPEEQAQNIPGLKLLLQKISELELDSRSKSALMMLVTPKLDRIYKKLPAGDIDQKLKEELTATYSQITNVPQDKLVVFAVTDRTLRTTVLLPNFYKLQELEQAVILLHESLWLLNGGIDYAAVVHAEIATHKFFTDPKNPDNVFKFYSLLTQLLNRRLFLLNAALKFDHQNKLSLLKRDEAGHIDLKGLLGNDFLSCYLKLINDDITPCRPILVSDLVMRSLRDPGSLSLKALIEIVSFGDVQIKLQVDPSILENKSTRMAVVNPETMEFNAESELLIPLFTGARGESFMKLSEAPSFILNP